jgi:hypothetical protein
VSEESSGARRGKPYRRLVPGLFPQSHTRIYLPALKLLKQPEEHIALYPIYFSVQSLGVDDWGKMKVEEEGLYTLTESKVSHVTLVVVFERRRIGTAISCL